MRQHGNYSFSRVYQAGHVAPSWQPEATYQIFQRAIFGLDIATGTINTEKDSNYSSKGDVKASQTLQEVPKNPEPTCYILYPITCTADQLNAVWNDTALIHDYIVIDENTAGLFPGIGNGTTTSGNDTDRYTAASLSGNTSAPALSSTSRASNIRISVGMTVAGFVAGGVGLGVLL